MHFKTTYGGQPFNGLPALTKTTWLAMKLTIVLLTACILNASASGYSQQVTFTGKDVSLEKVFSVIETQTGYVVFYNYSALQEARTVTVHAKAMPLEQFLENCFKEQPFKYIIEGKTILVTKKDNLVPPVVYPELVSGPIDVKGRIVNESGEPIVATIMVKGTSQGTTSNSSGHFTLTSIPENAVLLISAVNIETIEVKVAGRADLGTITAKTKITEGEVVTIEANTGYQKVKPNEVTGSLTVIDNKTFNQQTGTNILQRLNNVTSGLLFNTNKSNLNPQNKTNISIRGLSTINGPLDPLIVLDNFIYEGSIENINPNDVESITVLKDAAATSIWGARAGNGVIVITTKKGKFNQKLKIDFNSNVIITEKPDLNYPSQISSGDYIDVEQFIFNKGYFNNNISNTASRPALTPAVEIFLKRRNGLISSADSASQIDVLKTIDSRNQLNRYFYHKGVTQQYALNLQGGGNNIAWLISGNYDKSVYTLNNEFDKINLRFTNSYKPVKNLELDLSVYYTGSKAKSGVPIGSMLTINSRQVPYLKFADDNGNPLPIDRYRKGYIDTVGAGKLLNWNYYPLKDYKHDVSTNKIQGIVANAGVRYQILRGLGLKLNYQYQKQSVNIERAADINSFFIRDLINRYAQINYSTGIVNYVIPNGGFLNKNNTDIKSQNIRAQIDYNASWKEHSVSAIVGTEIREVISSGSQTSFYGYNEDPLSYGIVDYINTYPTRPGGSRQIPNAPFLYPTTNNRFVSEYANASYTYKNRYTAYGSIRRDASNVFGQSINDRWNPLWSSGVSWDISKESFYHVDIIPQLKIKATYGYSGNVDVSKTPLAVASGGFANSMTNYPVYRISSLNNPSLRWEKVNQLNIGVEFSLKNQVLSGSIDYYRKKGYDLYGSTPLDYTAWGQASTLIRNVAGMKANGVDVILKSKIVDREFKWLSTALFNYNTSKTTSYYTTEAKNLYSLLQGGNYIYPVIDYPLYSIAAYKWAGLSASGDPQGFLNGVGSTDYNTIQTIANKSGLDSGNIVYVGRSSPPVFGSLINEFSWKGFSASFNISYNFGYYFRKAPFTSGLLINSGVATADYEKRWQKPGDELITNVPAFVYTNYPQFDARDAFYTYSEVNVLKADNIRLQYVNLGYTMDKKTIKNLPFEAIQLYLNAANLGIIWRANKEKLDPDYPNSLRPPKTYTIGFRANF